MENAEPEDDPGHTVTEKGVHMVIPFIVFALLAGEPEGDNKGVPLGKGGGTKLASATNEFARLTVRYQHSCVVAKPKSITVTVENVGKCPLIYHKPNVDRQFEFEVFDSDGKRVPLTRHGKSLFTKDDILPYGHQWRLAPGEKFEMTFEIQRAFDMTVPDEYKINVRVCDAFRAHTQARYLVLFDLEITGIKLDVRAEKPE